MKLVYRSTDRISRVCAMCCRYAMPITAERYGFTLLPEGYFND